MSIPRINDSSLQLRKCALTLHGMSDSDREWMMTQLSLDHRNQLQPLLEELALMNFQVTPAMLSSILNAGEIARTSASPVIVAWDALESFSPKVWLEVLSGEHEEIVEEAAFHLSKPLRQAIAELDKSGKVSRFFFAQNNIAVADKPAAAMRDQCLRASLHLELQKRQQLESGTTVRQARAPYRWSIAGLLRFLPMLRKKRLQHG